MVSEQSRLARCVVAEVAGEGILVIALCPRGLKGDSPVPDKRYAVKVSVRTS